MTVPWPRIRGTSIRLVLTPVGFQGKGFGMGEARQVCIERGDWLDDLAQYT